MTRLATAALQAIALLILTHATLAQAIRIPLLLVALYIPVLVMLGTTQLRPRHLAVWAAAAACALLALGYHEAARGSFVLPFGTILSGRTLVPRFAFWLPVSIALFIAHTLVVDSVSTWSLTPDYRKHFDTAWKLGLQAALAILFVGVFWAVLGLGAALFGLIGLHGVARVIAHDWFCEPATTLALALSIQATDVQPALIRGTREIVLALFSRLLPLLAAILAAFLLALPFNALRLLFNTHFAASLLLTAGILLIFLINCSYQEGAEERAASRVKRLAASLGAAEILPFAALAIAAIALRVRQHGWSVQRIEAATVAFVVLCYAAGYLAALWPGRVWFKRLERTNLIAAYLMVALVLLLNSTLADPARLMVASQLDALDSHQTPPDKFDFDTLKTQGARWGRAALNDLAKREGPENQATAKAALAALTQITIGQVQPPAPQAQIEADTTILPAGRKLPDRLATDIINGIARLVLNSCAYKHCVAQYLTFAPGARESLVVVGSSGGTVLEQDDTGKWSETARLAGNYFCPRIGAAIDADQITVSRHPYPDILIGTERYSIEPESKCK